MKKSEWLRLLFLWGKGEGGVHLGDEGWGIVAAFLCGLREKGGG